MKKLISILLLMTTLVCLFASCNTADTDGAGDGTDTTVLGEDTATTTTDDSADTALREKYEEANRLLDSCEYEAAYQMLKELGDYEDSIDMLECFVYVPLKNIQTYGETTYTYEYNENNLPSQVVISMGEQQMSMDYTYDEAFLLTKIVYTQPNGTTGVEDFTYDENGNLIKDDRTDYDGSKYIREYTYDGNNNLIKEVRTYHDNSKSTIDYTYDASGSLTKEEQTDSNGNTSVIDYTYDASGNLTKKEEADSDGNTSVIDYTYDASGNLIKEEQTYPYGHYVEEYTIDANGNKTKIVYTQPDGSTAITEIEYRLVYISCEIRGILKDMLFSE